MVMVTSLLDMVARTSHLYTVGSTSHLGMLSVVSIGFPDMVFQKWISKAVRANFELESVDERRILSSEMTIKIVLRT